MLNYRRINLRASIDRESNSRVDKRLNEWRIATATIIGLILHVRMPMNSSTTDIAVHVQGGQKILYNKIF